MDHDRNIWIWLNQSVPRRTMAGILGSLAVLFVLESVHTIFDVKQNSIYLHPHNYSLFFSSLFSGQYFAATIVLLSMSTALTVVILNIFHRGEYGKEVPGWIKTLVLDYLGRVLLLNRTIKTNMSHRENKNNNEPAHVSLFDLSNVILICINSGFIIHVALLKCSISTER